MEMLGQVASHAIDLCCGQAQYLDKLGQEAAGYLNDCCPSIFSGIGLYWRSNIVIAGMVITGIASIIALVEGVISVAIVMFASFLILSFSLYYISRYAEIAEMEVQLGRFNKVYADLEKANEELWSSIRFISEGSTGVESNLKRSKELEEAIAGSLKRLLLLEEDIVRAESRKKEHMLKSEQLQDSIFGLTQTLTTLTSKLAEITNQFTKMCADIQSASERLGQTADKGDSQTNRLQTIAEQLENLVIWAQMTSYRPIPRSTRSDSTIINVPS